MSQPFITEMKSIGFDFDGDVFNITDRNKGYDNDCSDAERNDSFYESQWDNFSLWASPIMAKVSEIATKHSVSISIDTSAEYGMIDVVIK